MRAVCDPFAARQPISAAAITQMAITANIVLAGEACTMKKTIGDDHSSDHATVRHGMNHRDSGRTLASAPTRNGVASMASSHAVGTVGGVLTVCAVGSALVFSRLALMRKYTHAQNAATYSEAMTVRTPRKTQMGASSQGKRATESAASTGRISKGARPIAAWTPSTTGTGSSPAVRPLTGGDIVLPRTVVNPCIAHSAGQATARARTRRVGSIRPGPHQGRKAAGGAGVKHAVVLDGGFGFLF